MTRGEIRTLLRRHIQDTAAVAWTTDELDSVINLAYANVQKEIIKADPEAHLFWDRMDTTAGTNWYPLLNSFGISHVAIKGSSSDTVWTILSPRRYRDFYTYSGTSQIYTKRGQWIGVYPAPTVSVTNGLEVLHAPIMAIGSGLSNDSEVPRIKTPLHLAIVYWSKLIALGDTDEQSGETRDRLQEILGDLPNWYNINNDEPARLQVDF